MLQGCLVFLSTFHSYFKHRSACRDALLPLPNTFPFCVSNSVLRPKITVEEKKFSKNDMIGACASILLLMSSMK
jgi:hypothetical protein